MKRFRNIMLVVIGITVLFTTSCKKKEIEKLEEDNAALQADKDALQSELNSHHCMYGYIKIGHDFEGAIFDTNATQISTCVKYWVWYNTSTKPANPTSGANQGPLYATVSKSTPEEGKIWVDGLTAGIHYVYTEATALDSMGMSISLSGGKALEIIHGTNHCLSVHIHAE